MNNFNFPTSVPGQTQVSFPGIEAKMEPAPIFKHPGFKESGSKLSGRVAIITGGDSGIGRGVAVRFAQEGARVVIVHHPTEMEDAKETLKEVEKTSEGLLIAGDLSKEDFIDEIIKKTLDAFGKINILVNNAGVQFLQDDINSIKIDEMKHTFAINFFAPFFLSQKVVPYLKMGDVIINTTSVTCYEGNEQLIDYSASKGALAAFTRSLAKNLAPKGIRVNAVAPGPIWTPLIPSTNSAEKVAVFGNTTPLGRLGQPAELAAAYLLLASDESSFMTGTTIHVNGGKITNI